MTRPTDWTMSTCDLRGDRNMTASSAGTSTPSLRQRAFVRIRHDDAPSSVTSSARSDDDAFRPAPVRSVPETAAGPAPSASQDSRSVRSRMFIFPST